MSRQVLELGIVAGEDSGDILGSGMVNAIRRIAPDVEIRIRGIGGPRLKSDGLKTMCSMSDISIMGFDGLLKSLPAILRIRKNLIAEMLQRPPHVFVGIDVPDFNLPIECKLKTRSIPTVHYVSPTVWAWRSYRIRKIRRSVDHMLVLFPFEAEFYQEHDVPVTFVGHPMADEIEGTEDGLAFRAEYALAPEDVVIGVLPGSRKSEIDRLAAIFLEAAVKLSGRRKDLKFIIPFASDAIHQRFLQVTSKDLREQIDLRSVVGRAREVIAASNVVLLASGTAALETALLRRPMVVSYRASRLTEVFFRLFGEVKHFSMPNHLLDEPGIPELIQNAATPANLVLAIENWLDDLPRQQKFSRDFDRIHRQLRQDANHKAARVVLDLAGIKHGRSEFDSVSVTENRIESGTRSDEA